jgi:hypothetical protein
MTGLYFVAKPSSTERVRALHPRPLVWHRCWVGVTVDRALKKGTVGGDVGMQMLFEPAMLLSLATDGGVLYELARLPGASRQPHHQPRPMAGANCHR